MLQTNTLNTKNHKQLNEKGLTTMERYEELEIEILEFEDDIIITSLLTNTEIFPDDYEEKKEEE